jgi:MFS family permease
MDTLGATIGVLLAYFLLTRFSGNLRSIFLFSLIPAFLGVVFLFLVKEGKREAKPNSKNLQFKWNALDKRLKLFLVFTFIFTLGNSSNQFLLLRAKNSGSPVTQVILFYLVYNIVYCLATYPASRLSDKIGRKRLLVFGYLLYGLVYLGFAINNSMNAFWLLFGTYGLYIGFTEGVEKALVADIAPAYLRATAIGLHATLVGVGLLPASLFAGLLWKYLGASAPFYFGGLMGIFASAGLWFILKGI